MVKSANCYQDLEPTNCALSTIGFADRNQDIPMVYPDVPRLHSRKQAQPRDMRTLSGPGGEGGYSIWKPMGVCRWPLKNGPKKIEGKMEFGAKKI